MRSHVCRFCVCSGNMPHLALLCGLWQSENASRYTAGTGLYGFGQDFPAVAEVPQMALLCGLLGFIKTAGAEKYRSCRKYSILQFRFIYQSVADWLCVIVSAASDLSKAVFFIQLFCRLVIAADFKKNAFYAVIFAFIYEIFH